ncbi:hypothetical protein [Streptomyces sp. WM6378]|uniref:hypothetical protein n=1 Tax=Streptomyces sp. WM6378 TaxID=1415557 RepID=UPI0006ADEF9C|nr:hypothetical protein ADK54_41775 [Streptomyces sp. WM6378]
MTATDDAPVLGTPYLRGLADYWNTEKNPVNYRLGEIDGLYHHHYGLGEADWSVLEGRCVRGVEGSSGLMACPGKPPLQPIWPRGGFSCFGRSGAY